jgi:hypothetical protein
MCTSTQLPHQLMLLQQGNCGACVAFATTVLTEFVLMKRAQLSMNSQPVGTNVSEAPRVSDLSEADLMQCHRECCTVAGCCCRPETECNRHKPWTCGSFASACTPAACAPDHHLWPHVPVVCGSSIACAPATCTAPLGTVMQSHVIIQGREVINTQYQSFLPGRVKPRADDNLLLACPLMLVLGMVAATELQTAAVSSVLPCVCSLTQRVQWRP